MGVHVDEPGRHQLALELHRLLGIGRVYLRLDRLDPPAADSDVEHGIQALARIVDVPPLHQQIVHRKAS